VKMIFRADGHRESAQGMRRPAWAGVNAQVCGAGDITAIKTERPGFPISSFPRKREPRLAGAAGSPLARGRRRKMSRGEQE
ncbi:hypothetical protein, partial [Ferrovibrio sp.]|uniref:hypothetical protein n=1 Tax=Ferrovibrio sp. TaxID=1917215 RepID=UPI00351789E1